MLISHCDIYMYIDVYGIMSFNEKYSFIFDYKIYIMF